MNGRATECSSTQISIEERARFMSEAECRDVTQSLARLTPAGAYTTVWICSSWTGNVRWARNQVSAASEVRDDHVTVQVRYRGAESPFLVVNDLSDAGLRATAQQALRLAAFRPERAIATELLKELRAEPITAPKLFSDATYQLDAERRASAARNLARAAADAHMLSAGYIEVSANVNAILDTIGRVRYFPYTNAQYSVTVRDPKGTGSGWAGLEHYDWTQLDPDKITRVALDKCIRSQNPVRVEPGRYTTILEPQAVCDFISFMMVSNILERRYNEADPRSGDVGPFFKALVPVTLPNEYQGTRLAGAQFLIPVSKLGERIVDERLTFGADPMDPELGFPPFDKEIHLTWNHFDGGVYHAATWIQHGVLTALPYDRDFALSKLGTGDGLPNSGAFRVSVTGPTQTLDEMVQSTKRGLLVTRFDQVRLIDKNSLLMRGFTCDGLWLIEDGRISKPVKNMAFTDTILGALNRIEQLGEPHRVLHRVLPGMKVGPAIVPAMKINDFSFTALSDAV